MLVLNNQCLDDGKLLHAAAKSIDMEHNTSILDNGEHLNYEV